MKKVLIIKLGCSETLENGIGRTVSLGDILRTTFILHFFKEYQVSWLADEKAYPLLEGNKYIDRVLLYNSNIIKELSGKTFDVVVNFEKLNEVYLLCDCLKIKNFFGFSSKKAYGGRKYDLYSRKLFELCKNVENRREISIAGRRF